MTSVFSVMNSVTPVCCFTSNRILSVQPKHTTRCPRFHCRKDNLPLDPAFFLLQLHSMILVLYQHHIQHATLLCDSRTKLICNKNPKVPFLGIDVKGGRERSHQSLIISIGGREYSGGKSYSMRKKYHIKDPGFLVFKRREVTCL